MNNLAPANAESPQAIEIGRNLALLRERGGLKQAELARMLTWSPAVLSRVESGEREIAPEELKDILENIGTPEAQRFLELLGRQWTLLERPPLDHPDHDLLWAAELVSKELAELRDNPATRRAFERRITEFLAEINGVSQLLIRRVHQIAFIGSIGIGKSTAIARLTGLELPAKDGKGAIPVLETGGGGVTVCEVHLRSGPAYGIIVDPRTEQEIRADVADFAEYIRSGDSVSEDEEGAGGGQGISKEIERAIRNMAGLKIRRDKGPNGKTIRNDEARELSQKAASPRELVVEILARMELHRRDTRDLWYDASSGKFPLEWVRETFERINNGKQSDVSLPRRIEIVVPTTLIGIDDLSVNIIDTKGIDRTAARADLEAHLDEAHTLAVLCSSFNNAPAAEPRLLLERARDIGARNLELNSALLVLPHAGEALAVKDESGIRAETVEEGYELKGEQVSMALAPIGLQNLPTAFYNAFEDKPKTLAHFLVERLQAVRQSFRDRMTGIVANARALLDNHEKAQTEEVLRAVGKMFASWVAANDKVSALQGHVQDSLLDEIAQTYASTVRASVRREGEWHNLSYSHHLGHGARRIAVLALGRRAASFADLCTTLAGNPDYADAVHLIEQAARVLQSSYDELLRKIQLMGETAFKDQLKSDSQFWSACENEWGKGPGYKTRVSSHNRVWFTSAERTELEEELRDLLDREWKQTLSRVTALFSD